MRSTFVLLCALALGGALCPGCNCSENVSRGCTVDDDCRSLQCADGLIPACMEGACTCNQDNLPGDTGRYAAMALRGPVAYVCAYNATYGDLVIGHQQAGARVDNWEFVDGMPEGGVPDNPLSKVRGGVTDAGDDVGKYCSIAMTGYGDPVMSYYDVTHRSLKVATFGAIRWHTHIVDKAGGVNATTGDDLGRWTSLTLDKKGAPGVAYYAEVAKGPSGMRESQLRFAQAKVADPQGPGDWNITVVTTRPMPLLLDPKNPPAIPEGVALFVSSARKPDDAPVVAFYDRERGNLMYAEYDVGARKWGDPQVLDGEDVMGRDTADVGWYPSVTMDSDGTAHISYTDASHDNLLYVNTRTRTPEVVDDGFRDKDEMTLDGLPSPVFHLVGDSSSIQLAGSGAVLVAYQDSTVLQLRLAQRDPMTGAWKHQAIAGHASPFAGAYGFYAQNRVSGGQAVLSSYAIKNHVSDPEYWVEIFSVQLGNIIM